MWQDLRHSLRSLRKSPGFTGIVALTLGLGLGANIALFSVARSVVLRPLPYEDPDRIVSLWSQWAGERKSWVSLAEYRYYRDAFENLGDAGLYYDTNGNLTDQTDPERVGLARVTPNLFDVLGATPALGRGFTEEEAKAEPSDVAVLSYELWNRRYGAASTLIGDRIELDGAPRTVVGVLAPGFRLPLDFGRALPYGVYVPMNIPEGVAEFPTNGGSHSFHVVARLANGATVEAAKSEALAWNQRLVDDGIYDEERRFRTLVIPVAEDVIGNARSAIWILLASVGFVLLIACVNIANLVLSRGQERRREIALRTALGAGRSRIFRHLMTESLLLAGLGGVVALILARWSLAALLVLEPGSIPRLGDARLDTAAILFAVVLTTATALLFGALPALTAARPRLRDVLTDGGRGSSASIGSQRFRGALVALQLAIAVVLVMAAGLMIRTFAHLAAIDPGFRTDGVLTMRLATPERDYPDDGDVISFYERLLEQVRELPGVESAGAARVLPLASQIGTWGTRIDGYEPAPGESTGTDWQVATDGYFEAMGIRLVEGRTFTAADRADSESVAIVNEAFARRYWPDESALGHRIMSRGSDDPPWNRIVGVVADVRHNGITTSVKQKWYRPHRQYHRSSGFTPSEMTLTIRTSVPPATLAGSVRAIVRELDPKLPLAEVRTLEDVRAASVAESRFTMALLVLLSALALVLAAVGVYGVISYIVVQRTGEIGIRLALGSTPRGVVGLVVREGLVMSVVGVAMGAAAAVLGTGLMDSVLYGVGARDPLTFTLVPLVLLVAALVGAVVPAVRAARVDPVIALRAD